MLVSFKVINLSRIFVPPSTDRDMLRVDYVNGSRKATRGFPFHWRVSIGRAFEQKSTISFCDNGVETVPAFIRLKTLQTLQRNLRSLFEVCEVEET